MLTEIKNRLAKKVLSKADQHALLKMIIENANNVDVWLAVMQAGWSYRYDSSIIFDEWTTYYNQATIINWTFQECTELHSLALELYGYDEDYEGEKKTAKKLYEMYPNDWISITAYAEVVADKEQSLKLVSKALELESQNGECLYRVARIFQKLAIRHKDIHLTKEAIKIFQRAIIYLTDTRIKNQTIRIVEQLSKEI